MFIKTLHMQINFHGHYMLDSTPVKKWRILLEHFYSPHALLKATSALLDWEKIIVFSNMLAPCGLRGRK